MKAVFIWIPFYFVVLIAFGQGNPLQEAIEFSYNKQFDLALEILDQYSVTHDDPETMRWHARINYWDGNIKKANSIYSALIEKYPNHTTGVFDYGKFLYENGYIAQAEKILEHHKNITKGAKDADIMLFYTYCWLGKTEKAQFFIKKIKEEQPDNEVWKGAEAYLKKLTSPVAKITYLQQADDQPLSFRQIKISGDWYRNRYVHPKISVERRRNITSSNKNDTYYLSLGNTFQYTNRLKVSVSGGIFNSVSRDTAFLTYSVKGKYKAAKGVSINAFIIKLPYQYSVSSIDRPFSERRDGLSIDYEAKKGTLGEMVFRRDHYPDLNYINNFYFWGLHPLIKNKGFQFYAGYSFSYSNAFFSTFHTDNSNPMPFRGPPFLNRGVIYSGYYDPYFTPKKQLSNMLLNQIKLGSDQNHLLFIWNANLFSSTYVPQGENNQGEMQYTPTRYKPLMLSFKLQFHLSGPLYIHGTYQYERLYFYQLQRAEAGLLIDMTRDYDKR